MESRLHGNMEPMGIGNLLLPLAPLGYNRQTRKAVGGAAYLQIAAWNGPAVRRVVQSIMTSFTLFSLSSF